MPNLIPTVMPTWATDPMPTANTDIQTPSAGKQAVGFAAGERPAAEHLNWLLHYLCLWAAYLNYYMSNWHVHYSGNQMNSPTWTLSDVIDGPFGTWKINGAAGQVFLSLPVQRGTIIKSVSVYCKSSNATATDLNARLLKYSVGPGPLSGPGPASSTTLVAATNLPAATADVQEIFLDANDYEVAQYEQITVRIDAPNIAGDKVIFGVSVNYGNP